MNGQFSFAIWDVRKKELFLARDRLGIRPLFYSQSDAGFVFASEIKCLFESGLVTPELDVESLHRVFTFWTVPTPGTVFKGIRELSPGHFMKIGPSGTTVRPYWQLAWPIISNGEHRVSEKSLLEEMEALLMDSIRLRLRADVQVAAYLSGGLDSSATTWFIQKTEPGVLNTFSIGFEDKEFDETSYQNEMSAWLGTNHKAVTSRREDVAANFGEVIWHTEVPLLRTGAVPMFQLSGLVRREGIKVVITGEGADEFLGGYNIFKEALIREFWSRQPNSTIRPLLLQKLYPYLAQFQGRSAKMLKFFYGHGLTDVDNPGYSHMIRWNNSKHVKEHLAPDLRQALTEDPVDQFLKTLPSGFSDWDLLSRAQWLESTLFLSGYLLSSQGDRVSMAHSVEGRYPFLDYRLVEFSTRIPADMRIRGLNEKYLLKKLMSERLPERILKRSKQAYRAPVSSSLLSDKAPAFLREQLSGDALRKYGLFNPATVEKLLAKMAGPAQVT
ncbi:MAG: asparagine synthase (glutamine-hydrolyzing), partial [Bacteroidales bacterium]